MPKLHQLARVLVALALLGDGTSAAHADGNRFDLTGPKVEVRVTRNDKMLPIAFVPNLQAGDKVWLHPDLPETQSVRYLMVVAFLRGTTNPPPDDWFIRIETWNRKVREEGVEVVVPAEAQQALVFLAPVTGGDFTTLRSAVRGRPGVFVRASQDLNEAGFEQARIEKYLQSIKQVPPGDAKELLDHSNLLARTLALRPNPECFKRDVDQQYNCLTQSGSQMLLDDGHGQTIAAALTTGPGSDFITAASYTQAAGAGVYSAYVGAVVDLARILNGLHTAQYQYIPAIAFPQDESLNLRLNTPPSFNNPKSVIVIGLPSIQKATVPPLRTTDAKHITCLLQPNVAIPVEGAPLVFSTGYAHDLVLHLSVPPAKGSQDLPLRPDAYQGGLVLTKETPRRVLPEALPVAGNTSAPVAKAATASPATVPGGPLVGTIRGYWGFDPFEGPTVPLQDVPGTGWRALSGEPLIAGHEDHLTLTSSGSACLQTLGFNAAGTEKKLTWKPGDEPNAINVTLPLSSTAPGSLQLDVHQYGVASPVPVDIRTYSEPAKLQTISLHVGDKMATLSGQHLDQVKQMKINDLQFAPSAGYTSDTLALTLPADASVPSFKAGEKLSAHVALTDGRVLDVPVIVAPPRPSVTIKSKSTPREKDAPIKLVNSDDLRVDQPITLVLKSPTPIPRNETIEVGTQDASLSTKLDFASGALVLQDQHTLRVIFDPLKAFGPSIFGPVRLRAVQPGVDPGDWVPLATLVRLPTADALACPNDVAKPCTLTGSSLFLIDSIAPDEALTSPVTVPEDLADTTLAVPHPAAGMLYLRLRDDPNAIASLTLPVQPEPTSVRPSPPSRAKAATTASN